MSKHVLTNGFSTDHVNFIKGYLNGKKTEVVSIVSEFVVYYYLLFIIIIFIIYYLLFIIYYLLFIIYLRFLYDIKMRFLRYKYKRVKASNE